MTVYPVKVQGDAAAGEIASAIEHLNRLGDCDVIIAGRGGGSLEDLWAFNEECVARAIHASHIPVVSAVGHEIDFTISDLVADVRALTPTQVGELVVPSDQMLAADVLRKADDASQVILRRLENARGALRVAAKALATRTPIRLLREKVQRVDDASARITVAASHRMVVCREKVKSVSGRLEAISPVAVLDRGYSVTLDAKGKTVRSSDKIHEGDTVSTVLSKGRITSRVTKSE